MDNHQVQIPQLTEANYKIWRVTLMSYAEEYEIAAYLTGPPAVGEEAQQAHAKKKEQALRLITATLTPTTLIKLGEQMLEHESHAMLEAIDAHYAPDTSADTHGRLMNKAYMMQIKPGESIESYITRHLQLRQKLVRAKYP